MSKKQPIDQSIATRAGKEIVKAFRYYNYVREFYGYLFDSLDLEFEEGDYDFDPARAPAEVAFPTAIEEGESADSHALALDKFNRAISAYLGMYDIVKSLDVDSYKTFASERGMLQDSHKFALTSIAEWFPTSSLWREFDEHAQKQLDKYANDAQSAVLLMSPLSLESAIYDIFEKQAECLEKFLPQKIEELKKLCQN